MAKAQTKADAIIAEHEAAGRKAMEDAAAFMATQGGARASAGRRGPAAELRPQPAAPADTRGLQAGVRPREGLVRRDVRRPRRDHRPRPGANMNKPPPELEDAAEREQWAASERTARDDARAPYLARDPARHRAHPLRHHRPHAVRGGHRAAAPLRPRASVRRLPRARPLPAQPQQREQGPRRVGDRACARRGGRGAAHMAAFDRAGYWVARRFGEPEVFDEDVAGALVRRANLQPEDCFGLPRLLHVRATNTDDGKSWHAHIDGILVFSRVPLADAHVALKAEAPLRRRTAAVPRRGPRLGGGRRVGRALPLHRAAHALAAPAPPEQLGGADDRLPRGRRHPQRGLLRRADHARGHGVAASRTSRWRPSPRTSAAPATSCHAAELLKFTYRDRAEYQEGRARWRAYQDEVLHAQLDHRSGQHAPLDTEYRPPPSFLSEVFDMFNPLDPMQSAPADLQPQRAAPARAVLRARRRLSVIIRRCSSASPTPTSAMSLCACSRICRRTTSRATTAAGAWSSTRRSSGSSTSSRSSTTTAAPSTCSTPTTRTAPRARSATSRSCCSRPTSRRPGSTPRPSTGS